MPSKKPTQPPAEKRPIPKVHHLEAGDLITPPPVVEVELRRGSAISKGRAPELRVYGPLPDDHPFYKTLGRVTAEWANLEHALDLVIWDLAKVDPAIGSCITSQIGHYRGKTEAIAALAAARGAPDVTIDYIGKISGIIGELARPRARFVHDAWLAESKGSLAQFVSFSAERAFGIKDIDDKAAEKLIAQNHERVAKIKKLRGRLKSELRASL